MTMLSPAPVPPQASPAVPGASSPPMGVPGANSGAPAVPGSAPPAPGPGIGSGASPGPGAPPQAVPQFIPNPAYAQWQQAAQKVQAVQQQNAQLQQQFDAAVALIKQDGVHGFRIDIEADSTIAPDQQAEQQNRTAFVKELLPLLTQVVPIAQGNPALAGLAKEITMFATRAWPVARPLEEALEKAFDAIAQMPPHPSQQPKSGSNVDSPADLALRAKESAAKTQIDQGKLALDQEKVQSQERIATMREMAEDRRTHQELALKTEHSAHQQALQAVRMTHLEAADAAKLT